MAEAALHDSEEKYRSLFDSGPNPIFVLEPADMRILDVNPAALDAYGYTQKEELIGRIFSELGEFEIHDKAMVSHGAVDWATAVLSPESQASEKDGTPFTFASRPAPSNTRTGWH